MALVAQPIQNALSAYSAVTGTWASLTVPVDTGDTFLADTNVALVAQPTQNQLRAYSAVTGTWASLGVTVDTGDTFLVGGNTAFVAADPKRIASIQCDNWCVGVTHRSGRSRRPLPCRLRRMKPGEQSLIMARSDSSQPEELVPTQNRCKHCY